MNMDREVLNRLLLVTKYYNTNTKVVLGVKLYSIKQLYKRDSLTGCGYSYSLSLP